MILKKDLTCGNLIQTYIVVNDSAYCKLLTTEYANWLEEFKEVQDKRVLWDLITYKIRQQTIRYIKTKARERRAKLT